MSHKEIKEEWCYHHFVYMVKNREHELDEYKINKKYIFHYFIIKNKLFSDIGHANKYLYEKKFLMSDLKLSKERGDLKIHNYVKIYYMLNKHYYCECFY